MILVITVPTCALKIADNACRRLGRCCRDVVGWRWRFCFHQRTRVGNVAPPRSSRHPFCLHMTLRPLSPTATRADVPTVEHCRCFSRFLFNCCCCYFPLLLLLHLTYFRFFVNCTPHAAVSFYTRNCSLISLRLPDE